MATDANVGRASTLDLFKLYDETELNGSGSQTELSRVLIKFDTSPISNLTSSVIDINSSKFKAFLKLYDISSGRSTPSNFKLIVYPLSQSFDEGVGRDVGSFNDLDAANFITASYNNGTAITWFVTGANSGGGAGTAQIDYITSGNFGNGFVDLFNTQNFVNGNEDLTIDVTKVISATIAGNMQNYGFRLSFSGTQETDNVTRFVKRFASRHTSNPLLRPKIYVQYDDSIKDYENNFYFDTSGTLFLQSFNGSSYTNLVSGSALTPVTGLNCILLNLTTGSFNFTVTGSQHRAGTGNNFITGLYSASFALSSVDSAVVTGTETLDKFIAASGSVTFDAYWKSIDGTFGYSTGSLTVKRPVRNQGNFTSRRPLLNVTNANPYYTANDVVRFRIFGVDLDQQYTEPVKRPRIRKSEIFDKVYYQVIDRFSGAVVIPYDDVNNSTQVSIDNEGMFFDFYMQSLAPGRSYGFQFYIKERGQTYISREDETYFDVRTY